MTNTKYIAVAIREHAIPVIILFPAVINHVDMAKAMKDIGYKVWKSAGFVDEFMQCYGESQGLGLKSKSTDTDRLHTQLEIADKKIKLEIE